jgi:hypothetical protein
LIVWLMISTCKGSDCDGFLGHLQHHRWYLKTATQVPGMRLKIALLLQ